VSGPGVLIDLTASSLRQHIERTNKSYV